MFGARNSSQVLAHFGATLSSEDADGLTPRRLALDGGYHACAQFLATATARVATGQRAYEMCDDELSLVAAEAAVVPGR